MVATLQVLKYEFQKFRILKILNFHPWLGQIKNMYGSGYTLKKFKVGRQLFFLENFFFLECIDLFCNVSNKSKLL